MLSPARCSERAGPTRRGCRSRRPCPKNRKMARRCPWLALSLDRVSRSRGRTAGHAVRPWTGAAPFSVIASPLSVARDAAHIRPDEEPNGLDLCVLHHQLLDLGTFTLGKDGRVLVSEQAHGNRAAREQEKFERDQPLF